MTSTANLPANRVKPACRRAASNAEVELERLIDSFAKDHLTWWQYETKDVGRISVEDKLPEEVKYIVDEIRKNKIERLQSLHDLAQEVCDLDGHLFMTISVSDFALFKKEYKEVING